MRMRSNAYTLTVRQGPERAKAFAGPKEKDRKPVDPPPIIQLQIRDPQDPTQNYLQSPYFFMCCNLCDANLDRPGQLAAAHQGEDIDTATQSALAGTLVSSLHRLKDVDNTDGGFFVFPDLSVKIEGDFRLRFSLFEMGKTRVSYIKSVTSSPFTVFTPRAFPGMSESTFLSRSFGDQGVKLRIRKEPRVLGKRSAPSDFLPADAAHGHPQQTPVEYRNMGLQPQHEQSGGFGPSGYKEPTLGYDDLPLKRQRMSIDLARRTAYEHDQRLSQRSYIQQRDAYGQYAPSTPSRGSYYVQGPSTGPGPIEYPFSHGRTNSSSNSSPFLSPRTEYPAYQFPAPNSMYQTHSRNSPQQYQQSQYTPTQARPVPQLAQSLPPYRPLPSSVPSQPEQPRAYSRSMEADEQSLASRGYEQSYNNSQYPPINYDRQVQPLARTLPAPSQAVTSLLPPLQSLSSAQPRRDTLQSYSSGGMSNVETNTHLPSSLPLVPPSSEAQNFLPQPYRGRDHG
ncbi:hypothetical protein HO133_002289 [Letharia lupina]|uniref:Velvet domain-containing protein n=1 Tax=Letharia lupina TaxID=560253 RepID=A0A8H6FB59_9LECA|nr:uncharacterized protein HO133_002289 [Letharia lupina]KAF6221433.1 hypothetical protein HO133_002289 [Letharia lupina]